MKKIIIQKEILITQKEIDVIIKYYEKMSKEFGMGFDGKIMNRDDIIREIKALSNTGKKLLLFRHKFNKWMKQEKVFFEKHKKLRKKLKEKNLLFD